MKAGKKGGADTAKFKMKPKSGSPAGIELNGRGRIIPLAERTQEDRAAALAAGQTGTSETGHIGKN
jgi:hypothetical protein